MRKIVWWLLAAAGGAALVSAAAVQGVAASAGPGPATVLKFSTMTPVTGPYVGPANPIRGVAGGGLPWVITAGTGSLKRDGHLLVRVRGLVLARQAPVPPGAAGHQPLRRLPGPGQLPEHRRPEHRHRRQPQHRRLQGQQRRGRDHQRHGEPPPALHRPDRVRHRPHRNRRLVRRYRQLTQHPRRCCRSPAGPCTARGRPGVQVRGGRGPATARGTLPGPMVTDCRARAGPGCEFTVSVADAAGSDAGRDAHRLADDDVGHRP